MSDVISHPYYELAVGSRSEHLFEVSLTIPATGQPETRLSLPAWIPGSYMIRDFARNITQIEAATCTGEPLELAKLDKQTWQFSCPDEAVMVRYSVFAFDLSVRSAFINDQYAFCNGTSVFLQVQGLEQHPHALAIHDPQYPGWIVETSMPQVNNSYQCDSYAELIDHPIFIGEAITQSFEVEGIEFVMLFSGDAPVDIGRICEDLTPVCQHHLDLFGAPYPTDRYVFMTLLSDTGFGGLEHRSSTALLYPRFDLPLPGETGVRPEGYVTFLSLCSHELFHTWHVKRIRPELMINPDLGQEVYTNQLWIYEGFTSFYDDLTLARTGLITPEKYLEIVGQNLTRLLQGPGRKIQSAAQSSFDAWTRFYKQDANSVNHIVSYYTKGGIIAMGLDLLIRQQSHNAYSLDTVMQHLWQDYGKDERGTPDDVISTLCQQKLGIDVKPYLDQVVHSTTDVVLDDWLADIGVTLHYRAKSNAADKGGNNIGNKGPRRWLGATVKTAPMGVVVAQVFAGSPACVAGLQINDTILAADDFVVNENLLLRMLNTWEQTTMVITVIRDGRVLTLSLPVEDAAQYACYFTIDDRTRLHRWLGLAQA